MGKVLHASKSGYFPFCLKNTTPYEDWPEWSQETFIGVPLETAMYWYWIVKTWLVSVPEISYSQNASSIYGDFLSSIPVPIAKEEDIVCGYDFLQLTGYDPDFDPGSGEDSFGIGILFKPWPIFRSGNASQVGYYVSETNTYYLQFITIFSAGSDIITTSPILDTNTLQITYGGNRTINFTATERWQYGGTYSPSIS
jgi:hypothetical protein